MVGDAEALLETFNPGQRVRGLGLFDHGAVALDLNPVAVDLEHRAAGQADDGVRHLVNKNLRTLA